MGQLSNHHNTKDHEAATYQSGQIALCPYAGCKFRCCEFQQGNYIVLYPGEIEAAAALGKSLKHLDVTSDKNGDFKAVCRASNGATCDDGYKPLDCKSYPFFPEVSPDGEVQVSLKGAKCPLPLAKLTGHRVWVLHAWQSLSAKSEAISAWLSRVKLVGYESIKAQVQGDLVMNALEQIANIQDSNPVAVLDKIADLYLGTRPRVATRDETDHIHRYLIRSQSIIHNDLYVRMVGDMLSTEDYKVFFSEYNQASQKNFFENVLPAALERHEDPIWREYIQHIV